MPTHDPAKNFSNTIKGYMAFKGLDNIHLAKKLNICEKTMGKYIREPLSMPVNVFVKMRLILNIPDEDVLALMK